MKIGLRVLLGYFVIVALTGLLLGRVFVQQVKPGVRMAMEDTLAETANVLAELAGDDMRAGHIADGRFAQRVQQFSRRDIGARIWGFGKEHASYRIMVTDARGIVVFDSRGRDLGRDNSRWNDVYRTLRGQYGARSSSEVPGDESSTVMHVAAPVMDGDRIIGVLTVAKPNRSIAPFIEASQQVILHWGFVLLGTALLIGVLAAWWLSRQLNGLRRYADAVSAGERASLPDSAGEFADLGRALESMRQQLDGRQYVERYVHSLTHELKSPLAAIRSSAELLEGPLPDIDRERFARSIGAQSQRMAEMIDKLLALADVEQRQRIEQPERVELVDVARAAVDACRERADAAGVRLQLDVTAPVRLAGDRFLLRQMLVNLVDNAIDFSPRGHDVVVAVRVEGEDARITVADHGSGIPDYARGRVFERFYSLPRPDGGTRSSGLGLTFVAEVAALHGGRVTLENRAEGGTQATIVLPAMPG